MKRLLPIGLLAFLGAVLLPQQAAAESIWTNATKCHTGATLESCVDFGLTFDDVTEVYTLTVKYLGSPHGTEDGLMTAVGLWDRFEQFSATVDQGSLEFNGDPDSNLSWSFGTGCHLQGGAEGGEGKQVFSVCAESNQGVNNGLGINEWITFSFTLDSDAPGIHMDFEDAFEDGVSGRAHIQALLGEEDCSQKLDTRIGIYSECGTSVPEPGTMLLLGTGLAGVLGMGAIRRRREDEVTEDEVA